MSCCPGDSNKERVVESNTMCPWELMGKIHSEISAIWKHNEVVLTPQFMITITMENTEIELLLTLSDTKWNIQLDENVGVDLAIEHSISENLTREIFEPDDFSDVKIGINKPHWMHREGIFIDRIVVETLKILTGAREGTLAYH